MFIVSFPRSGQHLLERLLKHIHNYYNKEFSYCEYYTCCQKIPCNKNSLFQKNHDFNLNLKLNINEKFIIIYRKNKIYQLESLFRLNKFRKNVFNSNINYKDKETFNNLIRFIKNNSKYYDNFVDKYIKSNKYQQALIIEYDDFLSQYKNYIKKIILFLNLKNDKNIDLDIDLDIEIIINTFEKIEYKNKLDNEIYKQINKILHLEI
jgi:hypothetical protein